MRLPLATDLKTRTGAPDKDARLKNCYVESKGPMNDPNNPPETAVRKRPVAQGGVAVGTGIAQGGLNGIVVYGDVLYPIPTGTTCNNASTYSVGDHVTINYQDFWAITNHVGNCPIGGTGNSDWSTSFVSPIPSLRTYATWNPLDSGAPVILSNGNLTVTTATSSSYATTRATIGKSSGKWYWEIHIDNAVTHTMYIGIGQFSANLNNYTGADGYGYAYQQYFNNAIHNGVPISYGSGYITGNILGIALDMDGGTLTYYVNGVSQGIAFTGLTGTFYPQVTVYKLVTSVDQITANFGASAFVYSAPAGFNSGLYV